MNMQVKEFSVQFVEYMPEIINHGMLYVSMKYSVVIHLCACGCGEKVVTPLSPDDWQLNYNGEAISLYPSIGNWDFPCQSHYWINRNIIIDAESWGKRKTYKKNPFFLKMILKNLRLKLL
ncbi:MAG: DUF6527 family protein [Bacteroidales bacterium]|nr:DUF6527 family protein [Bacteroidales bacterium]